MKRSEAEAALRARLTPEFLATLRESMLVLGWSRDLVELAMFEEDLHRLLGKPAPTPAEAYDLEDDDDGSSSE